MIRNIQIQAVLNGFLVNVGCQALVFTSVESLTSALGSYLKDPEGMESAFRKSGLNSRHTLGDYAAPVTGTGTLTGAGVYATSGPVTNGQSVAVSTGGAGRSTYNGPELAVAQASAGITGARGPCGPCDAPLAGA